MAWPGRTAALVMLAGILPSIVFSALAVLNAVALNRAAEAQRLTEATHALTLAVDRMLDSYRLAGRLLAESPALDGGDTERLQASVRAAAPVLGGPLLVIGPPPGLPILAHAGLPPDTPAELAPDLAPALRRLFDTGQPQATDLQPVVRDGPPLLGVTVPAQQGSRVALAIAIGVPPQRLSAMLAAQSSIWPGSYLTVIDGGGRLVAMNLSVPVFLGREASPFIRAAAAEARTGVTFGPNRDGIDVVAAFEHSAVAPTWTVVLSEPAAQFDAAGWRSIRMVSLALPTLLGIAGLALALALIGRRAAQLDAQALRRARAQVAQLHERLPTIIFRLLRTHDDTLRGLFFAGDAKAVSGWPDAPDISPQEWATRIEGGNAVMHQAIANVDETAPSHVDYRYRQPDGSWRWLRTTLLQVGRHGDGAAEFAGYTVNITAERETQAKLLASARLASLGELAAGLAHELRQPLATISMASENAAASLASGDLDNVRRKFERIVDQTQRAGSLIEHLRVFARGGEDRPPQAVPLAEVLSGALSIVGSALRDAGIDIEIALGPPPPTVRCRPLPLEQVLVNLLTNARDALANQPPERARIIHITAATDAAAATVIVTLADTGGGLAPVVLAHLFEPFVTTKAPNLGTGLGLAVCHGLITAMGGHITASNAGEGAVFRLTLPAAAP